MSHRYSSRGNMSGRKSFVSGMYVPVTGHYIPHISSKQGVCLAKAHSPKASQTGQDRTTLCMITEVSAGGTGHAYEARGGACR